MKHPPTYFVVAKPYIEKAPFVQIVVMGHDGLPIDPKFSAYVNITGVDLSQWHSDSEDSAVNGAILSAATRLHDIARTLLDAYEERTPEGDRAGDTAYEAAREAIR